MVVCLSLCRRFHPIRCIRHILIVVFLVILVSTVWQYASNNAPSTTVKQDVEQNYDDDSVNRRNDRPHSETRRMSEERFHHRRQPIGHDRIDFEVDHKKVDSNAQSQLDYIGDHLGVRYKVLGNEVGRYFVELTLSNNGSGTIEPCCWAIYFYHTKFLDIYSFNAGTRIRMLDDGPQHKKDEDIAFTLAHVNGYTFRIQPTNRFAGLESGERIVLRIGGGGWAVSRSEVIPNWYVANDYSPSEARLIRSTVGEELKFVADFDPAKRWSRTEEDGCEPFSPEDRYSRNKVRDLEGAYSSPILPTPLSAQFKAGDRKLVVKGSEWVIEYVEGLRNEALFIKEKLGIASLKLVDIPLTTGRALCRAKVITLHLSDNMPKSVSSGPETTEKYVLVIGAKKDCISIFSPSATGVFYGAITLLGLDAGRDSGGTNAFPGVVVVDGPRYGYRGVMVDVVRHFHSKEELLQLMEAMATYKLNVLHLHLADDEGWRLEIPGLDELTSFGSRRGHDLRERSHIMSLLGSGPFTNSSGSGFYSVSDFSEILRFATSHHISVIPEFDMPGHSHAAIKSMEARYARVKAAGGNDSDATRYLLSDLSDRSVYMSGQFYKDSAINPCVESSYRFVEHVVKEVVKIYKNISPLKYFHFGGDEVPQDAYTASPACSEFLRHHKKIFNTKDLKSYFVRRVALIVARYGLSAMGWEDAFTMSHGQPISVAELGAKEVVSQAWYNIWESGMAHRAYEYANAGYKVVLSPTTNFYYDNPQEPDPEDWGLHWATRYVNTKRSFNFMPEAMYNSMDFDFWGKPISKSELCDFGRVPCNPLQAPENIIGIEGVMWSELIRTPDRMDSMLWPRLLALAERSWHKANWESVESASDRNAARKEDWTNFANAIGYRELKRLEEIGVQYYIPRPGARIRNGKLYVNTAFPGLIVQVSSDGGRTWKDYNVNRGYSGQLLIATRSFDGSRRSVPVTVNV